MKRTLALFLALVMCLSLCACGGGNDIPDAHETTEAPQTPNTEAPQTPNTEATQTPNTEATEQSEDVSENISEETIYNLGDVIETDLFRITPSFTGYAHELANWPDENFMTPEGQFSGESAYSAANGKVAMYGEVLIEYIGNEKSDVSLSIGISVDYDDGYIFNGSDVDIGCCVSVDGKWSYNGTMNFEPLSSNTTRILRYCVEVPEQVEVNRDKSLLASFLVNGETFVYDFRSADVRGSDYDPRAEFYQPVDENTKAQIIAYLKENGLAEMGWYDKTVGVYTFTFGDTTVEAVLPINGDYQYEFKGTYEVFSGSILITWDYGQQMHLDYTFDGTNLDIIAFEHDR